jgi:MarR family transcriptional regulator, transcriptional regulator for hemolysin
VPSLIDIEPFDVYALTVPRPTVEPIGLFVSRTGRQLGRAFDETLAAAGGSLPTWLVLVSLRGRDHRTQGDLARTVGIEGPTLTHHLNKLEADGLVTRHRAPDNRRVQQVELTEAGEALFTRLLEAVVAFDRRLRHGLSVDEVATLRELLTRVGRNLDPPSDGPG